MGLKEKLLKNSTIKQTAVITDSKIFEKKDLISTGVPLLDVALYAKLVDGGMCPGIVQIAAESKHFKSKFALILAKAFLLLFPDGVVLFYDTEFGSPESYFDEFVEAGIADRVVWSPIVDIETLKHDCMVQIEQVEDKDKLFILIDSIGNSASKKEVEDSIEGKQAVDMTRAKALKSFFRMITPRVNLKDIYMVIINHTYNTLDMFSKQVAGGGTGSIYNSNVIWFITKAKEEEGSGAKKELVGYQFTIRIEKSRFVKEGSKIPIVVTFDEGIEKWSGMFDLALKAGYIKKISEQKYQRADQTTDFKRKDVEYNDDFWTSMLEDTDFSTWIENEYAL